MRRKMESEAYQKMMEDALTIINSVRNEDESEEKFADDFLVHLDQNMLKNSKLLR